MNDKYILSDDGKTPIPCEDLLAWGQWHQTAERHVADDRTPHGRVSTVFLGLDHGMRDGGAPVLWETMVFGGALDQEQVRYSSYDDAVKGHAEMLRRVNEAGCHGDGVESSNGTT